MSGFNDKVTRNQYKQNKYNNKVRSLPFMITQTIFRIVYLYTK